VTASQPNWAHYPDQVAQTLVAIDKMNPAFVNAAIGELAIKDDYKKIAETAIARAKEILQTV
jgi:hypothetical protein